MLQSLVSIFLSSLVHAAVTDYDQWRAWYATSFLYNESMRLAIIISHPHAQQRDPLVTFIKE